MTARITALVRNFMQTDGDALYLVPGEKIFVVRGNSKTVVGREVLSDEAFRDVVAELVPGASAETLAQRRYRVPFEEGAGPERAALQFGVSGGLPALMITRQRSGEMRAVDPREAPPTLVAREPAPAAPAVPVEPAATPLAAAGPAASPVPKGTPPVPPISISLPFPEAASMSVIAKLGAPRAKGLSPTPGQSGLEAVLASMVAVEATEAHIVPGAVPFVRLDGELLAAENVPVLSAEECERMLTPVLPGKCRAEVGSRGSTRFLFVSPVLGRFRVHAFRERGGLGAVFLRLPVELPPAPEELRALTGPGGGLVLLASAAGGGRSTTRSSLLAHLVATRSARVVTIEDPIEVPIEGRLGLVSQREVGSHGADIPSILSAALGERPDVVALCDVPDAATAALVAEAASAGILVFVAVRAVTAVGAIAALTARLPEERRVRLRSLVGSAVRAVVVQVLCRRREGGRVAAFELLPGGPSLAEVIALDRLEGIPSLVDGAGVRSGTSLNGALVDLVRRGVVEPREALARSYDPARLGDLLVSAGLLPPS